MTMDEYLAYDDGTDTRYELVDGELVEMLTESNVNALIARFLLFEFAKYFPIQRIASKNTEIAVTGKLARCRLPNLLIHSEDSYAALMSSKQAVLLPDMPPPSLIVEVVSPGKENRDRDYRYKHTEYAARGVTEYWIIDPEAQRITLCRVEGQDEDTIYEGVGKAFPEENRPIQSTVTEAFDLSAARFLAFGQPEED